MPLAVSVQKIVRRYFESASRICDNSEDAEYNQLLRQLVNTQKLHTGEFSVGHGM